MKFQPTKEGYYGQFGGAFIPELLYPNVKELEDNYLDIIYYFVLCTLSILTN